MSAKHKGSFLCRYPTKEVDADVLASMTKAGVSCIGFAMAGVNNGVAQVMSHKVNLRDTETDVPAILKAFDKTNVIIYSGYYPDQFQEDDIQPFELFKNPQGTPAAVLFIDGDLTNFQQPTSTHSEEFFACNNYLLEMFTKIYNEQGQDIGKFMDYIGTNNFVRTTVTNMGGIHPLSVMVLGQNDKTVSFGQFHDYDWGWMSGASAAQQPAPEPAVEKLAAPAAAGGFAGFTKPKGAAKPVTSVDAVAAHVQNKTEQPIVLEQPKSETAIPKTVGPDPEALVTIIPPPWVDSNNKLSDWYDRKGTRPKNYKERPPITIPMRNLSTKEMEWVSARKETSSATNAITGTKVTEVPVAETKQPLPKTETAPSSEMVAVQKIIGTAGQLPTNPLDIQADGEPKWDSWADMLKKNGILIPGLEAMFNWEDPVLQQHIKECPELTLALIKDLRRLVILDYKTKPTPETKQTPHAASGFDAFTKKKATG